MPYAVEIDDAALEELAAIKLFYRRQIVDSIEGQLIHHPNVETRNRKVLTALKADFEHNEPVWELRVRNYRIYYDINDETKTVVIRAVREKPPHVATEQIT
jgi:mRNA-degrading endonuclease RelE of RelBE toxin-antitoxin system